MNKKFNESCFNYSGLKVIRFDPVQTLVHVQNFGGGGWQAVSLGGGVTVMEKREILGEWLTKQCLKCTKKLG